MGFDSAFRLLPLLGASLIGEVIAGEATRTRRVCVAIGTSNSSLIAS